MDNLKIYMIRIFAIAALVAGWSFLDSTGIFTPPPGSANGQEPAAQVLSGHAGQSAPSDFHFVPVQEALQTMSPDVLGIFLHLNNEAKFYPLDLLQEYGPIQDNIAGRALWIHSDSIINASPSDESTLFEIVPLKHAYKKASNLKILVLK